uniref:TSA: Wollemia nobilis Ref_Wollemi_Transcript_13656_1391 transcribed RNA sequence n=1 Tax=Wollemia nobilis TaxID=56998 RepID=A0A0C9RTQ3_9CONI
MAVRGVISCRDNINGRGRGSYSLLIKHGGSMTARPASDLRLNSMSTTLRANCSRRLHPQVIPKQEFEPRFSYQYGTLIYYGFLFCHSKVCAASITCTPHSRGKGGSEKPNVKKIHSNQELIDYLTDPGQRLLVVEFYSNGCGACRALHPKVFQLAAMNSDVKFVRINVEDNAELCSKLNVCVVPFFQIYGGPQGRVHAFSCTIATVYVSVTPSPL